MTKTHEQTVNANRLLADQDHAATYREMLMAAALAEARGDTVAARQIRENAALYQATRMSKRAEALATN